jgi:hypothetical protein
MKKSILFWVIAVVITALSAVFQRVTGPTYPLSGSVNFEGKKIDFKLDRSHSSSSNYNVEIKTGEPGIKGIVKWRKNYIALEPFTIIEMKGTETLTAEIPAQAPLDKIQYIIELQKDNSSITIPQDKPIIVRFKGDVPIWILIPHIFAMFFAMMLSTRTALETFNSDENKIKSLSLWTLILLFIGGFPLGFMMNYFAFGQLWGGIPFGNDITDNKTLIAFIGWALAFYMIKKNAQPKLFAILAAVLMIIVYSIPHSV